VLASPNAAGAELATAVVGDVDYGFSFVTNFLANDLDERELAGLKIWDEVAAGHNTTWDCGAVGEVPCTCVEETDKKKDTFKVNYLLSLSEEERASTLFAKMAESRGLVHFSATSQLGGKMDEAFEAKTEAEGIYVAPPEGCANTAMATKPMGGPDDGTWTDQKLCKQSRTEVINSVFKDFNTALTGSENEIPKPDPAIVPIKGFHAAIVIGGKLIKEDTGALQGGGDELVKLLVNIQKVPTYSYSRSRDNLDTTAGEYTHFDGDRKEALTSMFEAVNALQPSAATRVAIFYFFATTGTPDSKAHMKNLADVTEFNEVMQTSAPGLMSGDKSVLIHATTFHASPSDAKTSAGVPYNDKMVTNHLFQYDLSKIAQTLALAKGRCDSKADLASKDACKTIDCMLSGDECGDDEQLRRCGGIEKLLEKWGPNGKGFKLLMAKDDATQVAETKEDLECADAVSKELYYDTATGEKVVPKVLAEQLGMGMVKIPFMLSNTIASRRLDAFYPSAYDAAGKKGFGAAGGCGLVSLLASINARVPHKSFLPSRFKWAVSPILVAQWHISAAHIISNAHVLTDFDELTEPVEMVEDQEFPKSLRFKGNLLRHNE